jgi:hypothetical protein
MNIIVSIYSFSSEVISSDEEESKKEFESSNTKNYFSFFISSIFLTLNS